MSPPINIISHHDLVYETQCSNSSQTVKFRSNSSTAGFSFSKMAPDKSNPRSRPRLVKMRRKVQSGNKFDFSSHASSHPQFCNVFGDRNYNARNGDSIANSQSFSKLDSKGFSFCVGQSSSIGASTDTSDTSNLDSHKENRVFPFGACKTNLDSGHFIFASGETIAHQKSESSGVDPLRKFDNLEFVSGSDKCKNDFDVDSDKHGNVNSFKFVFGKAVDQEKQRSWKHRENGSGKENAVPDMMFGDGIKDHGSPATGFSNNEAEVDIGLKYKTTYKADDRFGFANCGKDVDSKFQSAHFGGTFVFGASKGNETSQVRGEKRTEDCNGSWDHDPKTGSCVNLKSKYSSKSGACFEKEFVCKLSNEMKGLNIAGVNGEQNLTCSSVNVSDTFIFGRNKDNSVSMKKYQPSGKSSDTSHLSQTESTRISPPFPSSTGVSVQLNGGFCGVSFNDAAKEEEISFRSKLDDFHSSDPYNTPNMKFPFSKFSFSQGVHEISDNANGKHGRSRILHKKKGKSRQRTLTQDLFGKNCPPIGNFKKNSESPVSGSPMEFSPYQDSISSNAPPKGIESGNGSKTFTLDDKYAMENSESANDNDTNSKVGSLSPSQTQDGLSAIRGQYKKKYRMKVGLSKKVQGQDSKKGDANTGSARLTIHEACEHWRLRGNEAYHAGKHSKAEDFYSTGIDSVPSINTLGPSAKPLLLCYSNRAASRMSLGRLREAIDDCRMAVAIDPSYLKVTLRAGNCHLILGEVDDAIQCFSNCMGSGNDVCLDRRITIDAADGLLKAKKVSECMCKSAEHLQEGTYDAAHVALENVADALSISRYSEKLLEMKGEALCILRMYDEVIELCEQTLPIAKRNFIDHSADAKCKNSVVKLWRWNLQTKCYYHLGKLDLALRMIEQREVPTGFKFGDANLEGSTALVASIRELLSLKKSGNEAFRAGKFTEAIEHYTSAISKSVDSRPFMAICLCNRAAAYQSMSQIIDAIADCSLAIALDENYRKAISRRATLHEIIRDYKQATLDLQKLVSLVENQSHTKTRDHETQDGSGGASSVRDLRQARRQVSLMEEKTKKDLPLDLYSILGIKSSDTESEIKKAYRKAALRHHPDKAGQLLVRSDVGEAGTLWKEVGEKIHSDADKLFKVIGEAYAVLSDPSKRSKYDDEEEMRDVRRNSNRNSSSECPSTSYSSPYGKGYSAGRNNRRWHWYDARSSYDSHNSR